MFLIHSNWNLEYSCTSTKQTHFHRRFQIISLNIAKSTNYPTRNAQDYSIYKAKKVFADRAIRTTGPTLWNSLDSKLKYCKTAKNFRNKFKSSVVNNYD